MAAQGSKRYGTSRFAATDNIDALKRFAREQGLSTTAENYMAAMADPFSAEEAAMPASLICIPTRKMKVRASGTLSTSSTNGNGFISIRPMMLAANTDQNATNGAIRYTTATFTGAAIAHDTTTAPAGSVAAAFSNSDFSYLGGIGAIPSSTGGIAVRLVTCAIEVEAITPWSTRGGSVTGVCEPDHLELGGATEANLNAIDASFKHSVSSGGESKFTLKYNGPVNPAEFDFNSAAVVPATAGNNVMMAMFFSGPNSQQYNFNVVAHFEVIGSAARGKTASHPDPVGAGLVQAAIGIAHHNSGQVHHEHKDFFNAIGSALHEGLSMTTSGLNKAVHIAGGVSKFIASLPGPKAAAFLGTQAINAYSGGVRMASAPRIASGIPRQAIAPRASAPPRAIKGKKSAQRR